MLVVTVCFRVVKRGVCGSLQNRGMGSVCGAQNWPRHNPAAVRDSRRGSQAGRCLNVTNISRYITRVATSSSPALNTRPGAPLDESLLTLRAELEHLDYVVVPHGDHICVRLPLISSVRIRHNGARFRFTAQFGPFRRSGGLLFTSGVSAAAFAGTAFAVGLAPLTLVVGFLGVIALAHDACRFVITEGCLTRLQNIIAASSANRSHPERSLSTGQAASLLGS